MCRQQDESEKATETPSHSDTFREAELARGKSILTQREDNVLRCVERAGQTGVTLTDIIHRVTQKERGGEVSGA